MARDQQEWGPWRRGRPTGAQSQREAALPRHASQREKQRRNSPAPLSSHCCFSFWYLPLAKPRQWSEAWAALRGPLLGHRAEQRSRDSLPGRLLGIAGQTNKQLLGQPLLSGHGRWGLAHQPEDRFEPHHCHRHKGRHQEVASLQVSVSSSLNHKG